jgi:hypothetical protein
MCSNATQRGLHNHAGNKVAKPVFLWREGSARRFYPFAAAKPSLSKWPKHQIPNCALFIAPLKVENNAMVLFLSTFVNF